jgi:5'-nucleotidase
MEAATGKRLSLPKLEPSVLVDTAGVRVGFIGVLTMATPRIVMPRWFAGLGMRAISPAISEAATKLRAAGASAIVVLAHAGAECRSFDDVHDVSSCDDGEIFQVARELPPGLVDVIVAGHTHAGIAHVVNGISIVEAYASGRAFSRIDLFVDPTTRRVLEARVFRPHPLCPAPPAEHCLPGSYLGEPVVPSREMSAALAPYLERAAELARKKLGVRIRSPILRAHTRESPLGNLFVDLMLSALPRADGAIANGGSLRSDLPAGDLSYGALYQAMPFDNRLATLELTAGELKTVLNRHLTRDIHGIVSMAGLKLTARCAANGLVLELSRADGTPVSDSTRLVLVTSDYLATGGDDLFTPFATPERRTILAPLVRDVLASELARRAAELYPDAKLFDGARPRLDLPGSRPLTCNPP